MVVSNMLAHFAVYSGMHTTQLATHRHPLMIIDLFVYTYTFVGCGFEYRCGWHALMRETWARFQSHYSGTDLIMDP